MSARSDDKIYLGLSDSDTTTDVRKCVKIRMGKEGTAAIPPVTVPQFLQKAVDEYGDRPALAFKNSDDNWNHISYRDYQDKIIRVAKTFIKLGLEPRNAVGILGFNSPEWFYSELGAIFAGGLASGIYTTNSPDVVHNALETSNANIVVVDDSKQMQKIRQIRDRLPALKSVIQINGPYESYVKSEDGYYKWEDIEEMNLDDVEDEFQRRSDAIVANECCLLIYTSGTVGFPKAVMLSHDNVTWDARTLIHQIKDAKFGEESIVSYLPLSHIAGQMVDIYLPIGIAGCVYFADKDAMKGSLVKTLQAARPTRFLGVPRIYEKFDEKLQTLTTRQGTLKQMLLNWAKGVALAHHLASMKEDLPESWQLWFARKLVLGRIKTGLGLDNCSTYFTGAAPMAIATKEAFLSLDMKISEAFGMSECALHSACVDRNPNFQTVGKPLDGLETRIDTPNEEGKGEICLRGRHRFMGYMNEIQKTKDTIDEDGWLHTGDLGNVDEEGYLYITGRIKELIITAGGENIPPSHIENLVKKALPVVSNACLIGDHRKFLSVLVALKTRMNLETGAPLDELHPETIEWLKTLDLEYTKLSEIIEAGPCPKVLKAIEDGIKCANKEAISNAQKVQKFALLAHDFSIPTGEIGPTLKLKRNVVVQKYADIIENFYK